MSQNEGQHEVSTEISIRRRSAWVVNKLHSDPVLLSEVVGNGDEQAAEKLLPLVYDALRCPAVARMASEAPGPTLQPTALCRVRLWTVSELDWKAALANNASAGSLLISKHDRRTSSVNNP